MTELHLHFTSVWYAFTFWAWLHYTKAYYLWIHPYYILINQCCPVTVQWIFCGTLILSQITTDSILVTWPVKLESRDQCSILAILQCERQRPPLLIKDKAYFLYFVLRPKIFQICRLSKYLANWHIQVAWPFALVFIKQETHWIARYLLQCVGWETRVLLLA